MNLVPSCESIQGSDVFQVINKTDRRKRSNIRKIFATMKQVIRMKSSIRGGNKAFTHRKFPNFLPPKICYYTHKSDD